MAEDKPDAFWIDIYEPYVAGLDKLDTFSHVIVLSYLHLSSGWRLHVRPPWLKDGKRQTVGLFASRSPNRPNPIGLTVTELRRIEGNRIYTGPLDLFDGTPIIDIKPCISSVDQVPEASNGWLEGTDIDEHLRHHRHELEHGHHHHSHHHHHHGPEASS